MWKSLVMAALLAAPGFAWQEAKPPTDQQILPLYERCLQLIEAGGLASPELGRAGMPLAENMRMALESLKFLGVRQPQLHYRFLANLRAYLLLAESVPKPVNFPPMAKQQLAELRDHSLSVEAYFLAQIERLENDLRQPDRDNLRRYRDANLSLAPPNPSNPRVVFLGDSITDGWRLNEYFPGRDFVNRGISGQITGQMLGRFYADVVALRPAAVLILAGTNDIARGVSPETIQNNLTMMCDLAGVHKIRVILASILPVSDHHKDVNPAFEQTKRRPLPAILEMNRWIQSFCEKRGYIYLNYFPALAGPDGQLAPNLAGDGLHPNAAGYRVMAPLALSAIEKALGPAKPEPRRRRLF